MRTWELRLDISSFDPSKFPDESKRLAREGIIITTLFEESKTNPNCYRKLYDLENEIVIDIPSPKPYTPIPFEEFMRRHIEHPDCMPEGYFIAKSGYVYVGVSSLWRGSEELGDVYQGLTGVKSEYRKRGIAMALKLKVIEYARKQGFKVIKTFNDSGNVGILHVNEKLGFKRQPAWITFMKRL